MERASLNSTRNFKLPPIQGAVTTTSSLKETTWIPRPARPSQVKSTRIARDTFIPPPKRTIQTQIRTAPKNTYSEVTSSRLDLDLGHNLPRPYAVLPPIRSESAAHHTNLHIHGKSARLGRDLGKRSSLKSQVKAHPSHNNLGEMESQQSGNGSHINNKQCGSFNTRDANASIYTGEITKRNEENNNLKERKLSATFVLFMKGTRKGRRCGVCLENERTLTNVCELLKEIFLRRNMEEMYLI